MGSFTKTPTVVIDFGIELITRYEIQKEPHNRIKGLFVRHEDEQIISLHLWMLDSVEYEQASIRCCHQYCLDIQGENWIPGPTC